MGYFTHMLAALWLSASGLARGATLDMRQYQLSFADDFARPDISAYGPKGRWIAHTPWHGDFGDDVFDDPQNSATFAFSPSGLRITAHQDSAGRWHGGLICSVDSDQPGAKGFRQKYGYFVMDAKLPAGAGVWPAFWLVGTDRTHGVAEIDVMEFYGHAGNEYHITEHYWVNGHDVLGAWHVVTVPSGRLTKDFNRFGVAMTKDSITFYLNGREVWKTPNYEFYRQPMYMLADLAIGGGWPYDHLASPQVMQIRSIKAYRAVK